MVTNAGVTKGPKKLPTVDWTTVRAVLPCAERVMITLLDMVVAIHPEKIIPISSPGSMKSRFKAQRLTTPKMIALVIRKHWTWTNKCSFHLE